MFDGYDLPAGNPFGGGNNSFSPMPATSPFAQTHGSAAPQIQANPPASMQSYISAAPQLGANQPNSSQNPQTIGSAAPQGIASLPVNGQLYPSGGMQFQSGQPPAGSQSFNPSYPAARGTPMAGGLAGTSSPCLMHLKHTFFYILLNSFQEEKVLTAWMARVRQIPCQCAS